MATLLPGHRDLGDPAHRAEVAAIWGNRRVARGGGPHGGRAVRGGGRRRDRGALDRLHEPRPVDARPGDGARARSSAAARRGAGSVRDDGDGAFADLLLPASTWGEKEGTVTNSERRISRVRAAVAPPGEARGRLGDRRRLRAAAGARLARNAPRFAYADVEAVSTSIARPRAAATSTSAASITRCSKARRSAAVAVPGRRLAGPYAPLRGRALPDAGRPRDASSPTPYVPVADRVDARYPIRLSTGRLRDQWHGMSRTGRALSLSGHAPEPRIALHPADIAYAGLADGEWALVASRRGSDRRAGRSVERATRGQAFLPMHWGRASLVGEGEEGGVNELTTPSCDPDSRQPEFKHAAIRIKRAAFRFEAVWWRTAGDDPVALRERVRAAAAGVGPAIIAFTTARGHSSCCESAPAMPERGADRGDRRAFGVAAIGIRYEDARSGCTRVVVIGHRDAS